MPLSQQLGEVVVVHPGIGGAGQRQNPRPDWLGHTPARAPTAVAVGHGRRTMVPPPGEQPTEMAQREAQEPGRLPGAQGAVMDARQDMQPLVLLLGQRDRLPVHPPRVTDSLTR